MSIIEADLNFYDGKPKLKLTNTPRLYTGSFKTHMFRFKPTDTVFATPNFDDFPYRYAMFYINRDEPYLQELRMGDKITNIPRKCLESVGIFYISLVFSTEELGTGTNINPTTKSKRILTTNVIPYEVGEGPSLPDSDFYPEFNELGQLINAEREATNAVKDITDTQKAFDTDFKSKSSKFISDQKTKFDTYVSTSLAQYNSSQSSMNTTLQSKYKANQNYSYTWSDYGPDRPYLDVSYINVSVPSANAKYQFDISDTMTYSVYIKLSTTGATRKGRFYITNDLSEKQPIGNNFIGEIFTVTDTWQRFAFTFSKPTNLTNWYVALTLDDSVGDNKSNSGLKYAWERPQLDTGSIAPIWRIGEPDVISKEQLKFLNNTQPSDLDDTKRADFLVMRYKHFQIITIDIWLANLNMTSQWSTKEVVSVPTSVFTFKRPTILSWGAPEYYDSGTGPIQFKSFDTSNGILTIANRTQPVTATRLLTTILLY